MAKRQLEAQLAQKSEYKQSILDRAAQEMLFTEIMRTMWLVFEQMFKTPYTIMYPFEKGPLSPRFRGEHALRRYPSGMFYVFITGLKAVNDGAKETMLVSVGLERRCIKTSIC
jgi:formate hydrogenlyase subunit 6/NADH:ubiquinone oxidoreductase subunit I